jgi:hypothetical protein
MLILVIILIIFGYKLYMDNEIRKEQELWMLWYDEEINMKKLYYESESEIDFFEQ